jgi:glutamate/tyrosine decarboxylase-like PLP-dependent enzyme
MNESVFKTPLLLAHEGALKYLEGLSTSRVSAIATLEELRARLGKELPVAPIAAERVIADLLKDVEGGILGSAGGRFFAWAIGGSVPAALGADWLTSTWDQNAALYACGPAAAIVEEVSGQWLKAILGIPVAASFALVSGCQMAHATCLAAARNTLLRERAWDVEKHGLSGAPAIRVLASNPHGSILRAVRLLGLGEANISNLLLDDSEQATPEALETALEAWNESPVIVILQAGDLNTGSFDRYRELIPIAKRHGAWVHIDGAFGLWAAASSEHRHLLEGFEQADSWATDGHKWLNVPYDCGYAFVADANAHRAAMSHRAPYLVHDEDARDQIDWNPEWSRRGRGFSTYAALRQMGQQGIEDLVNRCCRHARQLVEGIGELEGVEVLWKPRINQGLVRFLDPEYPADEGANDRHTESIVERLLASGEAFFMAATWRGKRAMRVSVLNWQTNDADVATAVNAIRNAIGQ